MAKVLIEESDLKAIGEAHAKLTTILAGINVEQPNVASNSAMPQLNRVQGKFSFSQSSLDKFEGVDGRLVETVKMALGFSLVDFVVFEGLRTVERQKQLMAKGATRTMQSKHIEGLAVDLVPFIGGKAVWDWDGCAKIACAMDKAATQLGYADKITWGGAWDRRLSDYGGSLELYMAEVSHYKSRHQGSDFIDGPHFQIER